MANQPARFSLGGRSIGLLMLCLAAMLLGVQMIFPALHFAADNVVLGILWFLAGLLLLLGY
jgi:hypothetical protein